MGQDEQPRVGRIVTGDGRSTRTTGRWLKRRVLLAGAVLLSVALVADSATALVCYHPFGLLALHQTSGARVTPTPPAAVLSPPQAIANAQRVVQMAATPEAKATAYLQLGTAYAGNQQTSDAINAYQQATQANGTADTVTDLPALAQLATAYGQAGNRTQEIAVFQRIITVLQQSHDPTLQAQVQRYETGIANLTAGSAP